MKKILKLLILVLILIYGCKTDQVVTVDPATISPSPRNNYDFSEETLSKIRYLHNTFKEVDPSSFELWVSDFDRDAHPEENIALWMDMAGVYTDMIKEYPDEYEYHKEIYIVILLASTGDEDYVFSQIKAEKLSEEDIKYIYGEYRKVRKAQPIVVVKK